MKQLSKNEFTQELDKIVTYVDSHIENLSTNNKEYPFQVESLNHKSTANDVILDIEDINHIVENKDILIMSSADSTTSTDNIIESIILDFEQNNFSIKESAGILVYFKANSNYSIMQFIDKMEIIYNKCATMESDIIWGVSCDETLEDEYVKATVFMSYSKKEESKLS